MPAGNIALSVLFYVLAAIGAAALVFLLCVFVAGWYLAETLARNVVAAGDVSHALDSSIDLIVSYKKQSKQFDMKHAVI